MFENKDSNIIIKKYKKIYCNNCGRYGHFFRNCREPITSYGIICYYLPNDITNFDKSIKYLIVRRRNTLSYIEFIRGKYNYNEIDYLKELFNRMTIQEKEYIKNNDFEKVWNNLWINSKFKEQKKDEYNKVKKKFNNLKEGILVNNQIININYLIDNTYENYEEPEWVFPKGRRNFNEYDLDCAIREFQEETNYDENKYNINISFNCFMEEHVGLNMITYRTIYYIAKLNNKIDKKPVIDQNNKHQLGEVSDIDWKNYNNIKNVLRNYEIDKKNTIYQVHKKLYQLYKKKIDNNK